MPNSSARRSASPGLRTCRRCGDCCYAEIPVTLLDIRRMAVHLGLTAEQVFTECLQPRVSTQTGIYRIAKHKNGACLFLSETNSCSINDAKPRGCDLFQCDRGDSDASGVSEHLTEKGWWKSWEKAVAVEITKAYVNTHQTTWHAADFDSAMAQIQGNIVRNPHQKVKLGKLENGTAVGMIFDCGTCSGRGSHSPGTPVTLDDIRRLARFLNIGLSAFFEKYLNSDRCETSGLFTLKRQKRCVFFDTIHHCAVSEVKPMHCRFTPCPQKASDDRLFSALFLASGSLKQQYRHQLAAKLTADYLDTYGTRFRIEAVQRSLAQLDKKLASKTAPIEFLSRIVPFRYVDDTAEMK